MHLNWGCLGRPTKTAERINWHGGRCFTFVWNQNVAHFLLNGADADGLYRGARGLLQSRDKRSIHSAPPSGPLLLYSAFDPALVQSHCRHLFQSKNCAVSGWYNGSSGVCVWATVYLARRTYGCYRDPCVPHVEGPGDEERPSWVPCIIIGDYALRSSSQTWIWTSCIRPGSYGFNSLDNGLGKNTYLCTIVLLYYL